MKPWGYPRTFGALNIIVHDDFVEQRRAWRKRLFSWPWRPWHSVEQVPNPIFRESEIVQIEGVLHMTRATHESLKAEAEKIRSQR